MCSTAILRRKPGTDNPAILDGAFCIRLKAEINKQQMKKKLDEVSTFVGAGPHRSLERKGERCSLKYDQLMLLVLLKIYKYYTTADTMCWIPTQSPVEARPAASPRPHLVDRHAGLGFGPLQQHPRRANKNQKVKQWQKRVFGE